MKKLTKFLASAWFPRLLIAFLLVFMLARMVSSALVESPTTDEPANIPSGYVYLLRGDYIDGTHPPLLRYWVSLPLWILQPDDFPENPAWYKNWRAYGRLFLYKNRVDSADLIFWPRLMVMLLTLGLGLLIGHWAKERNGTWAGVLAVALFSLDPNFLAHGHYVTTDVAVTLAVFGAIYLFWKYIEVPSWPRLIAAALVFACALITKFSAMLLAPSLLVIAGLLTWLRRRNAPLEEPWFAPRKFWVSASTYVVVTILVILAVYRFEVRTISQDEQLREARWIEPVYNIFKRVAPEIGTTPEKVVSFRIPAYNFIKGLSLQVFHSLAQNTWLGGESYQYALGRYSKNGWWWYFPVAFAVKTPLLLMVALLIAAILGVMGTRRPLDSGWPVPTRWIPSDVKRHEEFIFLIVPVCVFMGTYMASTINIGHRYLLPLYPFLFVLASRVAAPWAKIKTPLLHLYVSIGCVLAALPSSLLIHPHYVSYFNELVGPSNGYKYLSDSNVDWGQDLLQLKRYIDKKQAESGYDTVYVSTFGSIQPEDLGILYQPIPKDYRPMDPQFMVAISVNDLLAISKRYPKGAYLWLRDEAPVDRIGYSIWIYELANQFVDACYYTTAFP